MHDVSGQLREWSTSLADSVEPVGLDAIKARRTGSAPTRRWLAVAASVVVVAGGVWAVATTGTGDPGPVIPATIPPAPTAATETTTAPSTSDEMSPVQTPRSSGDGDGLVDLGRPVTESQIVVATYDGVGDFTVHALDASQEEVALVIDVVGPSTGRYFTIVDEFQYFRIESQGKWTIETADASLAAIPVWSGPSYSGSGNDVLNYTGEPGILGYSHADDPNILIRAHSSDNGLDLVAVEADGEWTLTMDVPATTPEAPAATAAAAGSEADDVASCGIIDEDTIQLDVTNHSTTQSSYIVDVDYLDAGGVRISDGSTIVKDLRPGEHAVEAVIVLDAEGASACEIAEVERFETESTHDVGEVTCAVTGLDIFDDIAISFTATNGSSKLSNYVVNAALIRDGIRIATVVGSIENVSPGESASGDGLRTVDGPAEGVTCETVSVARIDSPQ